MHSVPGWSRPSIIAGCALLPAYLGLYLGTGDTRVGWRAIPRALAMSAMVTLSLVLLFGAVGLLLSAATSALAAYFPWAGLAVGVLLVFVAGLLLAGGSLCGRLGNQLADRMGGTARRGGTWGYAAFGLAYGLTSLGCRLPVFLTVVGTTLVVQGFLAGVFEFLLHSSGTGFLLGVLTIVAAAFKRGALAPVSAFSATQAPPARSAVGDRGIGRLLLVDAGRPPVGSWVGLPMRDPSDVTNPSLRARRPRRTCRHDPS